MALAIREDLRGPLYAGTGALVALLVVAGSIVFMNQQAVKPRVDDGLSGTAVVVERRERRQDQPPPPKREPQRRPQRRVVSPAVSLESALAGMDFGLPQFDSADLGAAESILGDGSGTMSDESVDVPPRPIVQNPMVYPPRAKAAGVTGYVLLSVLIGPTGMVEKVKVLEANPPGVFDDVAAQGVQTWRFEPASYKGEAVRVWATQRVRFDLG